MTKMIAAHVADEDFEKLQWLENQTGWSRSAIIREMIRQTTVQPAIVRVSPLTQNGEEPKQ